MIRKPIGLIGAGRLASALAPALRRAGCAVRSVHDRHPARARALCQRVRGLTLARSGGAVLEATDWILLTVPDREIAPLARRLATAPRIDWRAKTVLHHAGAFGLEPLAPLARRGAEVALLHPLRSLADARHGADRLRGARARIEGSSGGIRVARALARALGLVPFQPPAAFDAEARVAYHAAAAMAGNDLLALLDLAVDLLAPSGFHRRAAERALLDLARGALARAARHGAAGALTGPVVRGDAAVLALHLRTLRRTAPFAAEVHRLLSRRLVELAVRSPRPPDRAARERLRRVLAGRSRTRGV